MGKVKDELLFTLLHDFLTIYLPDRRKLSPNTIRSYKTTWNQLLDFTAAERGISALSVTLKLLDRDLIENFLHKVSANSEATYNTRLAAIKSFFNYASACNPEYISRLNEISAIKSHKLDVFANVEYMSEKAVTALLEAPDIKTKAGIRDQFFMILMYDTGARIQEILNLRGCDIKRGNTPTAILHGKGNKTRVVPLMVITISHFENYLSFFHPGESEFSTEYLFYSVRRNIVNS